MIIDVPIERLVLGKFGDNPNHMDATRYELLVKNMRDQRDGAMGADTKLLQPLLARPEQDGTYSVIDGEHRVRGALEAGWSGITVRQVQCTDAQARALRMGLNHIRGELDLAMVGRDIDFLAKEGWTPEEMSLTGFTPDEISTLLDVSNNPLDSGDLAAGAAASIPENEEGSAKTNWVLEIEFEDKKTYQRAKRRLRKLAGKGAPLSAGLMKALVED